MKNMNVDFCGDEIIGFEILGAHASLSDQKSIPVEMIT